MPRRIPRKKRPVEKGVPKGYDSKWEAELHKKLLKNPKGYDSKWEAELHKKLLKNWEVHNTTVAYVVEHIYHPDFIRVIDGKKILLESKGRFWDYQEYSKYIWIIKMLPKDTELVFLFASPFAPMPYARRRKDGSKRTHADWADSHEIRWFTEKTLPEEWQ